MSPRAPQDKQERAFRKEEGLNNVHRAMQLQRAVGEMVRTLLIKHSALGTVFAPVALRPRWQRWLTFGTTVLVVFTVNVWLMYSKCAPCFRPPPLSPPLSSAFSSSVFLLSSYSV